MTWNMSEQRKKKIIIIVMCFSLVILVGYIFFAHTNRGSSYALYMFGGWHAPIQTKWSCGKQTDVRVAEKFTLPLLFDEETKDELRGFWFYSYYRQCLFDNGYDFSGNAIPKSFISKQNGIDTYTNTYGGFYFVIPENAVLIKDNTLDVDFDDQLLVSLMALGSDTLNIHVYLKEAEFKSITDIQAELEHLSLSSADISSKEIRKNSNGVSVIRARENTGNEGIVFITQNHAVVHIFASNSHIDVIDMVEKSLANVSE